MKLTDILTHECDGIYEARTNAYQVVAMTNHFGKSLINITFEFYRVQTVLVGGIPAREGWHERPMARKVVAKKPCNTFVLTPADAMRTRAFADIRDCEWTQTL
jgi:hypothetical protein